MGAAKIAFKAMLGGVCLLLMAGCAESPSHPPAVAGDPPLPQPEGTVTPSAPSSASVPPAPPAASPAPLQTSSGAPVTTSPGAAGSSDTSTAFDNVELVNANLADKLGILRVGSSRTDGDLLSVFVGLKNHTGRVLEVEVQTIYKDKSGQALTEGSGSWIPMRLKPHEEAQYRSVAISEDATDFMVRIRRAVPAPAGSSQ
jgi:hypothetical protein